MQNFIFENPTRIIFGKGTISRIGREVKRFGSKVLLVYGQGSIKKNGVYDQVVASLREADISIVELPGVKSNPVLSLALEGIELARKEQVDTILAVGGGSVIDTAKTVAAGVKAEHDVWDFFTYKKAIKDALPILTVLTLSASASEMNSAAVITNEKGARKFSIRSPFIQPKMSILDPTVLYTLSPEYSAYSAVDAITHALEGYFNNSEPDSLLQDRLVEAFIKTIIENNNSRNVLIVGFSLGGYLASEFASQYPDRTSGLVLVGSSTIPRGYVSLPYHLLAFLYRFVSHRWLAKRDARLWRSRYTAEIAEPVIKAGFYHSAVPSLEKEIGGRDFLTGLKTYAKPVLIVNGEKDRIFRKGERLYQDNIINSEVVTIKHAGHMCSLDVPEEFNRYLVEFADSLRWD